MPLPLSYRRKFPYTERTLKILAFLLAAVSLSVLDEESYYTIRIEQVIQRWHSPVTYRSIGDGWFEFRDTLSGQTFRQLVADARTYGGKKPKKIITIDIGTIDTSRYSNLFERVAIIPLGTGYDPISGYVSGQGNRTLIGARLLNGSYSGSFIYMADTGTNSLKQIYKYHGFGFVPIGPGIFYSNNKPQFAGDSSGSVLIFEPSSGSEIPNIRSTERLGKGGGAQYPRIYDFDNDGFDEVVFRNRNPQHSADVIVSKYDLSLMTFRDVYKNNFDNKFEWGSWAVGDFDVDGKGEFATVAVGGFVYFIEIGGNDSTYLVTFNDTTRAQNAGFNYEGNDLDGDGRPECFIGSHFFGGLTNIAVYESAGNDDLEVSLWIEIKGIGAIKHGIVTGDVDGDGRDELVLHIGGFALILKAVKDDDYKVMWMKSFQNEIGIRLFDMEGDGSKELLIGLIKNRDGFTEIYRFSNTTSVDEKGTSTTSLFLSSPFPNPTSPQSGTSVIINGSSKCKLTIYSSGGRLIKVLFNIENLNRARKLGIDTKKLPAGLYFILLTSDRMMAVRKLLVLK